MQLSRKKGTRFSEEGEAVHLHPLLKILLSQQRLQPPNCQTVERLERGEERLEREEETLLITVTSSTAQVSPERKRHHYIQPDVFAGLPADWQPLLPTSLYC
jgi:hypothetical protein